eukprot:TRINITY_DN7956_c0_g1_i1.p1 TRINITY_DN7956_c0_g1~~TRINITY_DN7956_c0_g1_i1.p1  ORF type:complete len:274 (-),score=45.71 TRINITY_DN7956_c0_g1_i1:166-987(-)
MVANAIQTDFHHQLQVHLQHHLQIIMILQLTLTITLQLIPQPNYPECYTTTVPDTTFIPTPSGTAHPTPSQTAEPTPSVTTKPTPSLTEPPTAEPTTPPPPPPDVLPDEFVEVQPLGETTNSGIFTVSSNLTGVQYSVSFNVGQGEAGQAVGDEIAEELNDDPDFSAAGCIASFGLSVLLVGCPGTNPEDHMISFGGGTPQPLVAADVNGIVFNPALEPPNEILCDELEFPDDIACQIEIGRSICTLLLNYGAPYDPNGGSCDPVVDAPTVAP